MTVRQIEPRALRDWLSGDDRPLLLDVREPFEVALAALPGARAIPLRTLPSAIASLDPDVPVVVLCHHGVRSMAAAHFLVEQGFDAVWNLTGGIDRYSLDADPAVPRY